MQHVDVGVAAVGDDARVQAVHGAALAFEHLQVQALALAEHAADAMLAVVGLRG